MGHGFALRRASWTHRMGLEEARQAIRDSRPCDSQPSGCEGLGFCTRPNGCLGLGDDASRDLVRTRGLRLEEAWRNRLTVESSCILAARSCEKPASAPSPPYTKFAIEEGGLCCTATEHASPRVEHRTQYSVAQLGDGSCGEGTDRLRIGVYWKPRQLLLSATLKSLSESLPPRSGCARVCRHLCCLKETAETGKAGAGMMLATSHTSPKHSTALCSKTCYQWRSQNSTKIR